MAPLISHLNACVLMHFQIKFNGWFCMGIFWPVGSGDLLPFLLREDTCIKLQHGNWRTFSVVLSNFLSGITLKCYEGLELILFTTNLYKHFCDSI